MEEHNIEETPKKVASINNQFTKEQIQQFQQDQKRTIYRRRRLAVVFAIASVFFVISILNFYKSYQEISQLKQEKIAAEAQQKELDEKIVGLEYEVELLGDQEYLQKLARQKYYYTKEGELVFSIPQLNKNNAQESKQDESAK